MTIGILGGTFNPPHSAHMACADQAHRQLGLDRVLLMPVCKPPHKEIDEDPGAEARVAMCELAAAAEPWLEVSTIEVDRGGPSYTADTLRAIHASEPEAELTFIAGADMAAQLGSWREPEAILDLARVAVAPRPGISDDDVRSALDGLAALERIVFLDMAPIDVSSSQVRGRIAAGEPISGLVPAAVADYIAEHALYGAPAGRGIV